MSRVVTEEIEIDAALVVELIDAEIDEYGRIHGGRPALWIGSTDIAPALNTSEAGRLNLRALVDQAESLFNAAVERRKASK